MPSTIARQLLLLLLWLFLLAIVAAGSRCCCCCYRRWRQLFFCFFSCVLLYFILVCCCCQVSRSLSSNASLLPMRRTACRYPSAVVLSKYTLFSSGPHIMVDQTQTQRHFHPDTHRHTGTGRHKTHRSTHRFYSLLQLVTTLWRRSEIRDLTPDTICLVSRCSCWPTLFDTVTMEWIKPMISIAVVTDRHLKQDYKLIWR